jgi:hypothetical protein
MRLRNKLGIVVALAGLLAAAAPAPAATLRVSSEWVPSSDPFCPDCGYVAHNVAYTSGLERNAVTIGGVGRRLITVRDPNVQMSAGPGEFPFPSEDVLMLLDGAIPIGKAWGCFSPQGRGNGACVTTAGSSCDFGGCYTDLTRFDRLTISLGGGSDALTLLRESMGTEVAMGSGDDKVDARNKVVDHIECGNGIDTVVADAKDIVYSTCETVTRG